ncbi:MAG TPA: polysaccharide biosynthesis tyrosine autokinase [Chthoniobacterales bacterium]|nr:polysaccharide biosynthesis tyrosine autokinase [Chthoniobacterales bacterium]
MNASPDATLHLDHWRINRGRIGLVVFVFLLTLVGAAIFTYFGPKNYLASATIEVQTDNPRQPVVGGPSADSTKASNFEESQRQTIFSHEVLDPVIRQLDLRTKWSQNGAELSLESAYVKLRRMVHLDVLAPNSIRVSVQAISPQESTLLANSIPQEYVNQQVLRHQATVQNELEQLQNDVQIGENAVSTAFARAARLRTEAGYADPNPDSSDLSLLPEDSTTSDDTEKVNEIQTTIAALKTQLEVVDGLMKSENLAEETDLSNLSDPVLEQELFFYQKPALEKARLLSSGLGPNHPDVRRIQGQIDAIEGQLRKEIANLRKRLSAQLTAAQDSLVSIETNVGIKETDQKRKDANARYLEAKDWYDSARWELTTAQAKLSSETTESANAPEPASIREVATTALRTDRFSISLNLLVGAALGLLLGAVAALLAGSLDRSIKTPQEVEKHLGLPLLAVVPKHNRRLARIDSEDSNEEPYQILRLNVHAARRKVAASVLAVVSGGSGEGRSTTAAKLAMAYAASEHQTLVIDAALRRPTQHKLFGIDNRIGLSDYLRGEKALDEIIQDSGTPNLYIVTSGSSPASAIKLFSTPKCAELVETVKEWFDVAIFDCPPILGPDGSMLISGLAEGSIIVAQHRRYPRSMVLRTKEALQNLGTQVLGVVLNQAYVRRPAKKISPWVAVHKRAKAELAAGEFETASSRLNGDDAY